MNKKKISGLLILLISGFIGLSSTCVSFADINMYMNTQPLYNYGNTTINGVEVHNAMTFIDEIHKKYYNNLGFNQIWMNMYDDKYMAYNLTPPEQVQQQYFTNAQRESKMKGIFYNMAQIEENKTNVFTDKVGAAYKIYNKKGRVINTHHNLKVNSCLPNDRHDNNHWPKIGWDDNVSYYVY